MATIEARITKVEHDVGTGWFTILTDHETVKKLTTKMEPKAKEAADLRRGGDLAEIEYSHKQRTDTTTGRVYNNHYYENARAASNGASNGGIDGIDVVAQPQTAISRKLDPAESWRICLGAGAKLAVATMPLMQEHQRDFETQKRIAVAWALWIYGTPMPGAEATATSDLDGTDDDIPF